MPLPIPTGRLLFFARYRRTLRNQILTVVRAESLMKVHDPRLRFVRENADNLYSSVGP